MRETFMNTRHLLSELSAALGLRTLQLDETDTCAVVFDDDLHVDLHFVEEHDALCLCLEVGALQPAEKASTLGRLLRANLDRTQLGRAHLALSESGDVVALCQTLPLRSQSTESLMGEIGGLVAVCRHWRERLNCVEAALA
jgi:hypothetical protein